MSRLTASPIASRSAVRNPTTTALVASGSGASLRIRSIWSGYRIARARRDLLDEAAGRSGRVPNAPAPRRNASFRSTSPTIDAVSEPDEVSRFQPGVDPIGVHLLQLDSTATGCACTDPGDLSLEQTESDAGSVRAAAASCVANTRQPLERRGLDHAVGDQDVQELRRSRHLLVCRDLECDRLRVDFDTEVDVVSSDGRGDLGTGERTCRGLPFQRSIASVSPIDSALLGQPAQYRNDNLDAPGPLGVSHPSVVQADPVRECRRCHFRRGVVCQFDNLSAIERASVSRRARQGRRVRPPPGRCAAARSGGAPAAASAARRRSQ